MVVPTQHHLSMEILQSNLLFSTISFWVLTEHTQAFMRYMYLTLRQAERTQKTAMMLTRMTLLVEIILNRCDCQDTITESYIFQDIVLKQLLW